MVDPASADGDPSPSQLASPRLWAGVALLFVLLFAGYWLFIRTDYQPLLTNLASQDAADILKVLDERKVPYRLADGGRSILVPAQDVDMARIELVGSELPMRGQVGFELFNQSDMGLTEFAQKINYQRALQGELARTILSLDGIRSVRVHLGLPERSVFRDEQAQPKASVTLLLEPGSALTEGTVVGIQQLVAGAIPEMRTGDVSVLDGSGRLISAQGVATAQPATGSDAMLENYRARIAAALTRMHPDLQYDINLSLRHIAPPSTPSSTTTSPGAPQAAPRGDPDFAVNVRVTTPSRLDDSLRLELMQVIQDIVAFDRTRGDAVLFLVGQPISASATASPAVTPASDRVVARAVRNALPGDGTNWTAHWLAIVLVVALLLVAAWYSDRRRKLRARQKLAGFADHLRERLRSAEGAAA